MLQTHFRPRLLLLLMPGLVIADIGVSDLDQINTVDIFTTITQPIVGISNEYESSTPLNTQVHILDGVEQFEAMLSEGLARDPKIAKRQVLAHFKKLDKDQYNTLQAAAEGLSLALQLGVERYPAIVLERHWVIYGETDLRRAMELYLDWRRSGNR